MIKNQKYITLYTTQSYEWFLKGFKKGFFEANELFIDEDFKKGYEWLVTEMHQRGVKSLKEDREHKRFPIWCWYRLNGKEDFKYIQEACAEYILKNKAVFLELRIPIERICFSLYCEWHCVLNNFPYFEADEEYDKYDLLPLREKGEIKRKSWEKIIVDEKHKSKDIQATIFDFKLEEIMRIKFFQNK